MFEWASYVKTKGAVKLHLILLTCPGFHCKRNLEFRFYTTSILVAVWKWVEQLHVEFPDGYQTVHEGPKRLFVARLH